MHFHSVQYKCMCLIIHMFYVGIHKLKKKPNTKIAWYQEKFYIFNRVTGSNLACIISPSIKFFQHSQTMKAGDYHPNVQQRYFLEGEHDVHKCDSTQNLADWIRDLNFLRLKNITAFRLVRGWADTLCLLQRQELFQITTPADVPPSSNPYTPLREALLPLSTPRFPDKSGLVHLPFTHITNKINQLEHSIFKLQQSQEMFCVLFEENGLFILTE